MKTIRATIRAHRAARDAARADAEFEAIVDQIAAEQHRSRTAWDQTVAEHGDPDVPSDPYQRLGVVLHGFVLAAPLRGAR